MDAAAIDAGDVGELCDGSSTVRMRYGLVGASDTLGLPQLLQNGWDYWLITGNCHYFVMTDIWNEVREGQLSPEQAQEISVGTHYAQLREFAGSYAPAESTTVHGATNRLGTATDIISCYGTCEAGLNGRAPEAIEQAMQYATSLVDTLFAQGTPVRGPIRISVVISGISEDLRPQLIPIDWPLSVPLEEVSIGEEPLALGAPYKGVVITAPADVAELRRMRDNKTSGEFGTQWTSSGFFWIGPYVDIHSPLNALRFRDTIPLEDADGVIRMEFDPAVLDTDFDAGQ
jgi:hypothetical protein